MTKYTVNETIVILYLALYPLSSRNLIQISFLSKLKESKFYNHMFNLEDPIDSQSFICRYLMKLNVKTTYFSIYRKRTCIANYKVY
jgi:hypothetical protein